ncbi:MAG TPA: cytochrome c oxidase assembly protein [Rhodanobacteraceae bacterium]|nr:cytochrome c oxidase assembly protein [Rhodanobacteraceae bacterium]
MSDPLTVVAYCGLPPLPGDLWTRWRLDPVVLAFLFAWLGLHVVGARMLRGTPRRLTTRELAFFCSGWTIATLALVSPLCPLSVALFSARATQHVILTLLAAPLIAASRPLDALVAAVFIEYPGRTWPRAPRRSMLAAATFAAMLWLWHSPIAYAATFASVTLYWTMHVTLFGSACWLWGALLRRENALVGGLLASIVSSVQMGLLGALITLSPRAFYAPHFQTTDAWGLTPLQDQELGGVIMWVPGCTVFLVVATIALGACLARGRPAAVGVTSQGVGR